MPVSDKPKAKTTEAAGTCFRCGVGCPEFHSLSDPFDRAHGDTKTLSKVLADNVVSINMPTDDTPRVREREPGHRSPLCLHSDMEAVSDRVPVKLRAASFL